MRQTADCEGRMKIPYVEDNNDKAFAEEPALARLDPGWQL